MLLLKKIAIKRRKNESIKYVDNMVLTHYIISYGGIAYYVPISVIGLSSDKVSVLEFIVNSFKVLYSDV